MRWRPEPFARAEPLLALLAADLTFGERADATLEHSCELARVRTAHLYLTSEGTERLRLRRSYVHQPKGEAVIVDARPTSRHAGDALPSGPVPLVVGEPADSSGALGASASPALELSRTGEPDAPVATPMGRMRGLRLDGDAGLEGLILLGPVSPDLSAKTLRELHRFRQVYSAVLLEAWRLDRARGRLDAALERLATSSRLQGSTLDPDEFLTLLVSLAVRATDSSGGFVAVLDRSGRMRLRAAQGLPAQFDEASVDTESGLFEWELAEEGSALLVRDVAAAASCGFASLVAVPLADGATPLGIMAIFQRTGTSERMPGEALAMLAAFAEQGRLMLGRSRELEGFGTAFVATLAGLSTVLDRRRPYTVGHHAAVTSIATDVGSAMGLPSHDLEVLRMAASIHDVGMAAAAQGGRGALASDTEHPSIGAALVSALPVPNAVATTIATHHEWWDGWGFPQGSSGTEIPVLGRVLALAEFVAEMAAPDPVRAAWAPERIAEELVRRRGTQFEPAVVDAALPLTVRATETVARLMKEFA